MPSSRSRIHPGFTDDPARWWRNILVPILPVLACFLGGATEKWSEGIVVSLFGIILLVSPPSFSLGRSLNLVLLAIVVVASIAFLPANWFSDPGWRVALRDDFGIKLSNTVSPQPWLSLGCFVSFLAGISWLYYVAALDLELREVRQQLRLFGAGVVLLAGLSLALHSAQTALPFWHNERGFGPFPNRNQTANLFGITAVIILACGQDDIRRRKRRWIMWLIGFGILVGAIITDFSRAGIVILVIGTVLWIGAFSLRNLSAPQIALGLSALLLLLTAILIFGGETFERLHLRVSAVGGMAPDLRWAIFKDTLQLIRSSPWCGIGFGNFGALFALFRDASLSGSPAIHPESDWLWLSSEEGWPIIVLFVVGIGLLVARVFPLREGTNQRFRLAALIAALLFVFHGLIDVSGHRIGTAFSGVFLMGMALRRPHELEPSAWLRWMFRLIGVLLLASGIAWMVATRYEMSLAGGIGVDNEMRKASAANQGRNFAETIQRTTRALEWAPLRWQLYFSRALGKAGARQPIADVLDDFRRARFLEPNAYEIPYQEGTVWLTTTPSLASAAWREALRRVGVQKTEIYGHMLALASQRSPTVRWDLEQIGLADHELALVYLQGASGNDFKAAVHDLLEHDSTLQRFSPREKTRFFSLWAERGDPDELVTTVEKHPDWIAHAWRAVAMQHAKQKDFRAAFELVQSFGEKPTLPQTTSDRSVDQLLRAFHETPNDFEVGYQLFNEQMWVGKTDDALTTARHFTGLGNCPPYFHFLEAEASAAKGNWEGAWQAWQKSQAPARQ